MTDNEITKALECCQTEYNRKCKQGCPYMQYQKKCISVDTCSSRLRADLLDLINRQKAEIESLKQKRDRKCGTCVFAKPTIAFGGSKCYVECTNQEHLEKYCKNHEISKVRQRTTPACKRYKGMEDDKNDTTGKN